MNIEEKKNLENEPTKTRKKETAQEAFKRLREQSKIEMLDRKQKIEDAQERAVAAKAEKTRKKNKGKEADESPRKESKIIEPHQDRKIQDSERRVDHPPNLITPPAPPAPPAKSEHTGNSDRGGRMETIEATHRYRKRRGKCTNCCGGLPGKGPGSGSRGCGQHCCCSENRLRGGSDTDRSTTLNSNRNQTRSSSEESRTSRGLFDHLFFARSSGRSFAYNAEESSRGGRELRSDSFPIPEDRERGGCGGCGGGSPQSSPKRLDRCAGNRFQGNSVKSMNARSCPPPPQSCCNPCPPPSTCQRPTELRCYETSRPITKGCCPCGGCGGAACSDNPGGGAIEGGCCGGSRPRGLPCKCKCQSCDTFGPLGGCGGQSCGKIYSCAGSSGGRCCFPRNHKRRSGPECCGGANSNCGGCC